LDLSGKIGLVTAASQGIGFAAAMAIAKAGGDVAIMARRKDVLEKAKEKIMKSTGRQVLAICGDVSDHCLAEKAVAQIQQQLGQVDILINNAGGPPPGMFMDIGMTEWSSALNQNLLSVVTFSKAVIPGMKAKKWGRIINVASTSVKEPMKGMVLSNATRTAVGAVSKTLSLELAEFGITVNTVCPGPTLTARADFLIQNRCRNESISREQVINEISEKVPVGRMAQPSEIGDAICFLSTDMADYITGVVLAVDGGLTGSLY
jgi:3-oxoacyl-[acyl-carrier protein] reductase